MLLWRMVNGREGAVARIDSPRRARENTQWVLYRRFFFFFPLNPIKSSLTRRPRGRTVWAYVTARFHR